MAQLEKTLASGVQSVQLRSASLPASQLLSYVPDAAKLCRAAGVPLILNSRLGSLPQLLEQPCDGVHFRREDWQMLSRRPLPADSIFSVACHSADELAAAQALVADVALLSPVLPTRSHPQAVPLGWSTFAQLCLAATVPVMALGGLGWADLPMAKSMGAQGIAGISGFWAE
jgi:thiamine-phosphate diphosphorylase